MQKSALKAKHLNLRLGNKTILDDLSVCFRPNELTILLGPNGTGKSSLLKVITHEWQAGGSVEYFGRCSSEWKGSILAKHLAVLPQSSNLTFNFTVREVVELGGLTLNETQKGIAKIATDNMRQTDIIHLANRLYPSLSGGEKQRVHLARILTQLAQGGDKRVMLLDEPTSSLDLSHQHQTLKLVKSLAREGASVIAVIHDLNLAAQYADRILILNDGKLVADGSPWETLTEQIISDVYQWPTQVIKHPKSGHPIILS